MGLWEGSEPHGLQEGQQTGPEHLFWRFLWPSCWGSCPTHLSAAFLSELFSKLAAATSWQTDGLRFGLFPQDRNQTILAQSCASGARRGVEEGTAHEHVGKGKNQMCYNGRQSRDFSSHNIKMAHMARSSMGPLMDVGFPSLFSLITNFHPAKLWKGEVWTLAGEGATRLFPPVSEPLRLSVTPWASASAFIATKPQGVSLREFRWRDGHP